MKKRKRYITEETMINIDEDVFKIKSEELICALFIDYVNDKHGKIVIELR
ncbi:hypothetical protein AB7942_29845 [Neobacillus sp. BF23-41]